MADDKDKTPGLSANDKLVTLCKDKEEEGMATTKNWISMWQENLNYFFSNQLAGKRLHEDWDWVILNYIWPSAMQEMGKLSKNYPKVLVNPWEDKDTQSAEAWQSMLQWLWEKSLDRHGMRIAQIRAILDGKLFGYRISKLFWEGKIRWDDEAKEWVGDVRHRLWHPAEFWASESEYIQEGDCGTTRFVTLDYAIHRWPKFEKQLKDKATKFKEGFGGGEHIRGQLASAGTYPGTGLGGKDMGVGRSLVTRLLNLIFSSDRMSGQSSAKAKEREYVQLSEIYFKDYKTTDEELSEDIPQEELVANGMIVENGSRYLDTATGQPIMIENWPKRTVKKWKQPAFPTGRYIIRCDDIILNPDKQDQVYPHSRWPFIVTPHYLLPHMWQGTDAVQMYKTNQDMINVTVSHLVNNMKMFGNPRVAVETGAIATPPGRHKKRFKIFSGAGAIIRLKRGAIKKYKIEQPVSPSQSAMQLYALFAQEYKNLTGLQDIGQGKKTEGQMTATESQFLAISANDRIHLQSVFEDEWVKQVASLTAEICQKNYSIGRMVRIVGEDKLVGATEITQQLKTVKFDVDIEPGQTLPFDEEKRIAKYEKAFAIVQQPVANPMTPEMLRVLEIPGWQKILEKYEAWQLYFQFYQLYEQVKAGQVLPQDAVNMLVQKATEIYMAEQRETVPAAPQENEQNAQRNKSA